jgi:MFS family permease
MALALVLVGVSAATLALVPAYYAGGTLTIVLYLFVHAVFVFGFGAQLGSAVAYVVEAVPDRAGFVVSLLFASSTLATVAALVLIEFGFAQLNWRLAVACGLLILPMAFLLGPEEARHAGEQERDAGEQPDFLWSLSLVTTILLAFALTSGFVSGVSGPLIQARGLGFRPGFWIAIEMISVLATCSAGWLYDRVGTRPIMLATGVPLGLLSLLSFALAILLNYNLVSIVALLITTVVIVFLQGTALVPLLITIARLAAPQERARVINFAYAGATALAVLLSGPGGRQMKNFEVMLRVGIWIAAMMAVFRLFPKQTQP